MNQWNAGFTADVTVIYISGEDIGGWPLTWTFAVSKGMADLRISVYILSIQAYNDHSCACRFWARKWGRAQ